MHVENSPLNNRSDSIYQDCVRTHVPILADEELVEKIMVLILTQRREMINKQTADLGITYAALNNPLEDDAGALVKVMAAYIEARWKDDPKVYRAKLTRARARHASKTDLHKLSRRV